MLPRSQDSLWVRRTKWLTQALIISGTLNIGLIATFVYFVLKDRQETLAFELKPIKEMADPLATNSQQIRSYSRLPYQELILRLESTDLLEEGLAKRDLSLACLVAFHHFNLDKALGGLSLQKRTISFVNQEGKERIDLPVFPGLTDSQFMAIMQYAKTEKWPLTSQGLFYEMKRSCGQQDPSLLEAFYLTSEYHAVQTLLIRTGLDISCEQIIHLICEGEWKFLSDLTINQRAAMELTVERRRSFLLEYLNAHSKLAAKFFIDTDLDFSSKRLNDTQILTLLDLYPDKGSTLENFSKELLASPRTDAVWKRAAAILYANSKETCPEPYDHQLVLKCFFPQVESKSIETLPSIVPIRAPLTATPLAKSESLVQKKKKVHTIEQGDNLWKIARKYHVSVEEIMRANRLDSEKLRPGKQLEIPDKASLDKK